MDMEENILIHKGNCEKIGIVFLANEEYELIRMKEQLEDILIGPAALTKNADGTIERCSMDELIGKDLEVVSSRYFSFNEIKNRFEQSNPL